MNYHRRTDIALLLLIVMAVFGLYLAFTADAKAHYYAGCKKAACKKHVIKPFKANFLAPVGACESGGRYGGTRDLRTGLRAVSPGGQYRGRYQFGIPDWARAGGVRVSGQRDPINAGWLDQAYVAVLWLHINGRQSWPNC